MMESQVKEKSTITSPISLCPHIMHLRVCIPYPASGACEDIQVTLMKVGGITFKICNKMLVINTLD